MPSPIATHHGALHWRMLALRFACRTSLGRQFQTLASTADPLLARFGIGYTEVGKLIGLFMLPGLFLSLPAGRAGRPVSDLRLVGLGLALMALGGLIAASAYGFGQLALARVVTGAGFVFCTLHFTKMVVDWFSGMELATALGILAMSRCFGIAAGQVGPAWLSCTFDWRAPFIVASLCRAVAAAAVACGYRPTLAASAAAGMQMSRLIRSEWLLTRVAAAAWAFSMPGTWFI